MNERHRQALAAANQARAIGYQRYCQRCRQPFKPRRDQGGFRKVGLLCEACYTWLRRHPAPERPAPERLPLKASDSGYSAAAGTARWETTP